MTLADRPGARLAPRLAGPLVIIGLIANVVIARLAYGDRARVFFGLADWLADFVKHIMSFPGPPLAQSIFPYLFKLLQYSIDRNHTQFGHFHNMPETVLISLGLRPLFSVVDPVVVYFICAGLLVGAWGWAVYRFAEPEARPMAMGLALFNYPLYFMLDRGNLFAGITAVCLLVTLCRRKMDWGAVVLMAIAANIRPNVAILALPLLSADRASLTFLIRTAVVGAALGLACLAVDSAIYPAYTLSSWLHGLALYKATYVIGPLGLEFGSSLWGALRQFIMPSDAAVAVCTLVGLIPLGFAWTGRERLSYAAVCFLAIAACTLSTAVLSDYHLIIFVVPLLLLRRDDPAYAAILLGACWMLIPKNYNPAGVLSWQTVLNPIGLAVAVILVLLAYRTRSAAAARTPSPSRAQ